MRSESMQKQRRPTAWLGGGRDACGFTTITTKYDDGTSETVRFKPPKMGPLIIILRPSVRRG